MQSSIDYWFTAASFGEPLKEKLYRDSKTVLQVILGDTYEIRGIDILKKLNWETPEN